MREVLARLVPSDRLDAATDRALLAFRTMVGERRGAPTQEDAFAQVAATPIIHYGGVCEGGVSCTGNRDLFDDFGVAADPLTGFASIVYSDDQYIADANNPAGPRCKPAQTNAPSCDHTSIATQTSGEGIFATEAQKQPKKSAPDGAAPAAAPATAQSAPQSASSGNPSVSGTIGPAVSDVGGTIDQVAVAADGAANTATNTANSATNTATNTAASAANTATNTVNSAVATVAPRTGGVNLP